MQQARHSACVQVPRVLVCGWSDHAWMGLLLREMDRGPAALPHGSEVLSPLPRLEVVKSWLRLGCWGPGLGADPHVSPPQLA